MQSTEAGNSAYSGILISEYNLFYFNFGVFCLDFVAKVLIYLKQTKLDLLMVLGIMYMVGVYLV